MKVPTAATQQASQLLQRIGNRPLVLFDGVCNLCNGAVDFIIRHDHTQQFLFASLQSEAGQTLLQHFGLPSQEYESMVLLKEGKYFQRSRAALEIAQSLGGAWRFFGLFKGLPSCLLDYAYTFLAQNRYRFFGKKESCRLPTPAERARFLG